jgi:ribonuclease G
VIKDPISTKGARLSTQVSLAGRLLVFLPQDSHIGISQRIEDEADRVLLRDRLQHLLPEGWQGGFIIRTSAETATEKELQADVEYLTKLWRDIVERSRTAPQQSLIYQDLDLSIRVLRDFVHEDTARILVDSRETFVRMREFAEATRATSSSAPITTRATGRCSTCTASRTRSRRRSAAAST